LKSKHNGICRAILAGSLRFTAACLQAAATVINFLYLHK